MSFQRLIREEKKLHLHIFFRWFSKVVFYKDNKLKFFLSFRSNYILIYFVLLQFRRFAVFTNNICTNTSGIRIITSISMFENFQLHCESTVVIWGTSHLRSNTGMYFSLFKKDWVFLHWESEKSFIIQH